MRMMEHLTDYYRFIGCFDIDPFVKSEINDTEILYNIDDDRYDCYAEYIDENMKLVYEFRDKYIKIRDSTPKSIINETKKEVVNIIKNISKKNVDELNKKVINLFNMDVEFKKIILP
jgi:Mg2+ and Co2+ transporter CorA